MYPSVFIAFLCCLLTVNGEYTHIYLREDCQLIIVKQLDRSRARFDITKPSHENCKDAEIIQFSWSKFHYIVITSRLNETFLNMGIVPIDITGVDKSTTVTIVPVDFSHVLGDDCRFDENSFTMGMVARIMYFVVNCDPGGGRTFALVRGILDINGHWYIPHGPLIRFAANKERVISGIFFWDHSNHTTDSTTGDSVLLADGVHLALYTLDYSGNTKQHFFDVRNLHGINQTLTTIEDKNEVVQAHKFRSSSGRAAYYIVWDEKNDYGCMTTFNHGEGAIEEQTNWLNQVNVPCTYRAQRVTVVNTDASVIPRTWTYIDIANKKSNITFECAKHSDALGKGTIKCKMSPWTIVMIVIVSIEIFFIVVIGITALMMFLKQKWSKRPKKIKIIKYVKRSVKESKKEAASKKGTSKKEDKKDDKTVVKGKKP